MKRWAYDGAGNFPCLKGCLIRGVYFNPPLPSLDRVKLLENEYPIKKVSTKYARPEEKTHTSRQFTAMKFPTFQLDSFQTPS